MRSKWMQNLLMRSRSEGSRLSERDRRSGGLVGLMARHAGPRRLKSRASAIVERRPAGASEDWVSQLPELIEAVCEDWHLSLDDERMAAGAWGVVAWCHTESGLEAALKLCANEQRLSAETNAMLAWAGRPAIRVLAHRPGALLLERARPGRPSRLAPARLALLLDALHRPTSAGWRGLGDWRTSIKAAVSQVPSLQTLGQQLLRQGEVRAGLHCTVICSRRTFLSTAAHRGNRPGRHLRTSGTGRRKRRPS